MSGRDQIARRVARWASVRPFLVDLREQFEAGDGKRLTIEHVSMRRSTVTRRARCADCGTDLPMGDPALVVEVEHSNHLTGAAQRTPPGFRALLSARFHPNCLRPPRMAIPFTGV